MTTKPLYEIPALLKIEQLAAKYASQDPELKAALDEVLEARKQNAERLANALKSKGIDCSVCGKRFLSTEWNGYRLQCSVGCRAFR